MRSRVSHRVVEVPGMARPRPRRNGRCRGWGVRGLLRRSRGWRPPRRDGWNGGLGRRRRARLSTDALVEKPPHVAPVMRRAFRGALCLERVTRVIPRVFSDVVRPYSDAGEGVEYGSKIVLPRVVVVNEPGRSNGDGALREDAPAAVVRQDVVPDRDGGAVHEILPPVYTVPRRASAVRGARVVVDRVVLDDKLGVRDQDFVKGDVQVNRVGVPGIDPVALDFRRERVPHDQVVRHHGRPLAPHLIYQNAVCRCAVMDVVA